MSKFFKPKFFSLLKEGISKQQIKRDIFAGIIVGIVAIPLSIAFAVASGVSPEKGLITAIIAGFLISLFGGSRVQIGGPTGALIIVVYGIIQQFGFQGLLISTVFSGVILILFGAFRLGSVLKYIPRPLILGFNSAIAVLIFSTQIKDALGLKIDKIPTAFIDKWGYYFTNIDKLNFIALGITVVTILITVYSKKITSKIPGLFMAIVVVTGITTILNVPVSTIGTVFGEIPINMNFNIPEFDFNNIQQYIKPAFTIAMLGAMVSLLSAVVTDGMFGGKHRSNTELMAQGIANIVIPFFGGIPATGAIARTATSVKNGGRTPIAGMVHSVALLLIMLVFGSWAKLIPMACLAGILIVVSYNMSEWRSFKAILKGSRYDAAVLITTFSLTVLVDISLAIEIGIVLSAMLFMYRMSKLNNIIPIEQDSDLIDNYNNIAKSIDIYEISGPFFFAAAKEYQETLVNLNYKSKVVILRMRHVPFIDSTGLYNFEEIIKYLKTRNISIILTGVVNDVRIEMDKHGITELVGEENIINQFEKGVERANALL